MTDGALSDTVEWKIDKVAPTVPRTLSAPLVTLPGSLEHPVYFNGWDMWLDPQDDRAGYEGSPPSSASSAWIATAGSTTSASRSSRCPSRRSSSATPAPT